MGTRPLMNGDPSATLIKSLIGELISWTRAAKHLPSCYLLGTACTDVSSLQLASRTRTAKRFDAPVARECGLRTKQESATQIPLGAHDKVALISAAIQIQPLRFIVQDRLIREFDFNLPASGIRAGKPHERADREFDIWLESTPTSAEQGNWLRQADVWQVRSCTQRCMPSMAVNGSASASWIPHETKAAI